MLEGDAIWNDFLIDNVRIDRCDAEISRNKMVFQNYMLYKICKDTFDLKLAYNYNITLKERTFNISFKI